MFQFFESICLENNKIQNLEEHQNRIDKTFTDFYLNSITHNLERLFKNLKIPKIKSKLRFLYNENSFKIVIEEYKEKRPETLKIVEINDYNYSYKFLDRSFINQIIEKEKQTQDILMTKNGLITDTSYANIAFFNGKVWETPISPLLFGTKRASLIKEAKICEAVITIADFKKYESFIIFNSMLDFNPEKKVSVDKILD